MIKGAELPVVLIPLTSKSDPLEPGWPPLWVAIKPGNLPTRELLILATELWFNSSLSTVTIALVTSFLFWLPYPTITTSSSPEISNI